MSESLENSPSLYLGKPWSDWANIVEDEDELNRSKHSSGHAESMRLKRDDMPLFGLCPAQDEFYLVVCEICKQVVKPQALLRHMEVRHGRRSKNHSPRRRKTSSTSSTPLSPTMSPPREEGRTHSDSKSSKHDVHGKTPPDSGGGETKRSSHDGSPLKKSSSSKHHALSNATVSLHKSDKLQRNHSMPVVKMERLPPTVSAKNNAPTLHVSPTSNHKPANSTSKQDKNNSKEHRDKSKSSSSSSHLSHRHESSHHSSKSDNAGSKSLNDSSHSDISKLSDDEDLFSLSRLKSKMKSESSSQPKVKSEGKDNDSEKHDINSTVQNDLSHSKRHSSSGHSHSSHHSKHRHSHSGDRSSSSKHSNHSDGSSSKQKSDKIAWTSNNRSRSPEKNDGSNSGKHSSSKFNSKSDWGKLNDKHDSSKHSSSSKGDKKLNSKGSESGRSDSGGLSDKQWNDITKLSSSKSVDRSESLDLIKVEDISDEKARNGSDDMVKVNGGNFSSRDDIQVKMSVSSSKPPAPGLTGLELENSDKNMHKPPALSLSFTTSATFDNGAVRPSLTSPTTPILTSPDSSVPTTPILATTTSTKHLDKIDINSPTSTFGKKLAALQNPGKLLPCKDREYNPDIHCGVISKEDNKPCTRSLTCKSHALSLRRQVPGRCKPFDELLLEHRAAKEAYMLSKKEAGHVVKGGGSKTPSASKSSLVSSSKIKSPPVHGTMVPKSPSFHTVTQKVPSIMTSPPPPPPTIKMPKLSMPATPNAVHKVLPLAVQLPPKPTQIADLPESDPVPVPELFAPAPGATSDNEDDDDYRDRSEFPLLSHHPRPAVVNCFGARNTGSGCYVFNRRTDQLRAVFRLAVDRRLHPPPHKKLCLDSRLPVSSALSSISNDPYEFGTGSPNVAAKGNKSSKSNNYSGSTGNKSQKAKEDVGGINYSAVFESMDTNKAGNVIDGTAMQGIEVFTTGQPTITTAAALISQSSNARSSSGGSATPAAKRKRSGSSPRPALSTSSSNSTASIGGFALNNANNAISIAIPTGSLNLNLSSTTLNSLNATIAGNKLSQLAANKNSMIKDVNIMVTGGTPTVLNGQILTSIPSSSLTTDGTQLQLKNSLSSPPSQKSKSRKRTGSRSGASVQDGLHVAPSVVNAIPSGAVFMDTSAGSLIASNSVAVVSGTSTGFGIMSAPVTSPSPAMTPSPLFTAGLASSIPNGIIGQQRVKGLTSLNHVGCAAVTEVPLGENILADQVAPLSDTTLNTLEHHTTTPSKHKKQKHLKALQQQQVNPQPSRLITSSVPYSIHSGTMGVPGTGYSHIQIQPKDLAAAGAAKTLATGKLAMQPMSLTIPLMTPGPLPEGLTVMQGQGQQRALLIPTPTETTDRGHHHHESIPQLTLQNSPSNLIS